jgi:acyl dehydratase
MPSEAQAGASALTTKPGEQLGLSPWLTIDQLRIDVFGAVTDDIEPLHNDPAWCARQSPYGGTIAHGFLTLSLLTRFLHQITGNALAGMHDRTGFPLNYGFDRVRFMAPVPVNARIRCRIVLLDREDRDAGTMLRLAVTIEIEDAPDKPALAAEWLVMWVDEG